MQPEPKVMEKRNPVLNVFLHVDSESAIKKSICQPPLLVIFSKNLKKWSFLAMPISECVRNVPNHYIKVGFYGKIQGAESFSDKFSEFYTNFGLIHSAQNVTLNQRLFLMQKYTINKCSKYVT